MPSLGSLNFQIIGHAQKGVQAFNRVKNAAVGTFGTIQKKAKATGKLFGMQFAQAGSKAARALQTFKSKADNITRMIGHYLTFTIGVQMVMGTVQKIKDFVNTLKEFEKAATMAACYDGETEVLTKDGWKQWKNTTYDDEFATLNQDTFELEYHKPTNLINEPYEGKMYRIKTLRFDLKVTPNHKMFVKRRYSDEYELEEARDIEGCQVRYNKYAEWKGKEPEYFVLPENKYKKHYYGRNISERDEQGRIVKANIKKDDKRTVTHALKKKKIPIEKWLEFFGYWISEGCVVKGSKGEHEIILTNTNPSIRQDMFEVIQDIYGNSIKRHDRKNIIFSDKQTYLYLKQFGKARDKYLPQWLKELSPRLLKIFFEAYMKGDGSKRGRSCTTASKQLRDDLEEIIIKMGWSASHRKKTRGKQKPMIRGRTIDSHDGWDVFINRTQLQSGYYPYKKNTINIKEEWVPYKGRVYCAEVPNHTLLVRRNGKSVWSGNSVSGYLGAQFDSMKQHIMGVSEELGRTTIYTATDAANAFYKLGSAGFDVAQIGKQEMIPMLDFAAATGTELEQAVYQITTAIRQFNLSMEDTAKVANTFVGAITSSYLHADRLKEGMKYLGPVMGALGRDIEETTAVLAALANQGFQGGQSGRYLAMVFSRLIDPTNKAKEVLRGLGLTVEQVNPKTHGLVEVLHTLHAAGFDASKATKAFGTRSAKAAIAAVRAAKSVGELEKEIKYTGAIAGKVAKKQINTLYGAFRLLQSRIQAVALSSKDVLIPLLEGLADFIRNDLMPIAQTLVNVFRTIGHVFGSLGVSGRVLAGTIATVTAGLFGLWMVLQMVEAQARHLGLIAGSITGILARAVPHLMIIGAAFAYFGEKAEESGKSGKMFSIILMSLVTVATLAATKIGSAGLQIMIFGNQAIYAGTRVEQLATSTQVAGPSVRGLGNSLRAASNNARLLGASLMSVVASLSVTIISSGILLFRWDKLTDSMKALTAATTALSAAFGLLKLNQYAVGFASLTNYLTSLAIVEKVVTTVTYEMGAAFIFALPFYALLATRWEQLNSLGRTLATVGAVVGTTMIYVARAGQMAHASMAQLGVAMAAITFTLVIWNSNLELAQKAALTLIPAVAGLTAVVWHLYGAYVALSSAKYMLVGAFAAILPLIIIWNSKLKIGRKLALSLPPIIILVAAAMRQLGYSMQQVKAQVLSLSAVVLPLVPMFLIWDTNMSKLNKALASGIPLIAALAIKIYQLSGSLKVAALHSGLFLAQWAAITALAKIWTSQLGKTRKILASIPPILAMVTVGLIQLNTTLVTTITEVLALNAAMGGIGVILALWTTELPFIYKWLGSIAIGIGAVTAAVFALTDATIALDAAIWATGIGAIIGILGILVHQILMGSGATKKWAKALLSIIVPIYGVYRALKKLYEISKPFQQFVDSLAGAVDSLVQGAKDLVGAGEKAKKSIDWTEKEEKALSDLNTKISEVNGAIGRQIEVRSKLNTAIEESGEDSQEAADAQAELAKQTDKVSEKENELFKAAGKTMRILKERNNKTFAKGLKAKQNLIDATEKLNNKEEEHKELIDTINDLQAEYNLKVSRYGVYAQESMDVLDKLTQKRKEEKDILADITDAEDKITDAELKHSKALDSLNFSQQEKLKYGSSILEYLSDYKTYSTELAKLQAERNYMTKIQNETNKLYNEGLNDILETYGKMIDAEEKLKETKQSRHERTVEAYQAIAQEGEMTEKVRGQYRDYMEDFRKVQRLKSEGKQGTQEYKNAVSAMNSSWDELQSSMEGIIQPMWDQNSMMQDNIGVFSKFLNYEEDVASAESDVNEKIGSANEAIRNQIKTGATWMKSMGDSTDRTDYLSRGLKKMGTSALTSVDAIEKADIASAFDPKDLNKNWQSFEDKSFDKLVENMDAAQVSTVIDKLGTEDMLATLNQLYGKSKKSLEDYSEGQVITAQTLMMSAGAAGDSIGTFEDYVSSTDSITYSLDTLVDKAQTTYDNSEDLDKVIGDLDDTLQDLNKTLGSIDLTIDMALAKPEDEPETVKDWWNSLSDDRKTVWFNTGLDLPRDWEKYLPDKTYKINSILKATDYEFGEDIQTDEEGNIILPKGSDLVSDLKAQDVLFEGFPVDDEGNYMIPAKSLMFWLKATGRVDTSDVPDPLSITTNLLFPGDPLSEDEEDYFWNGNQFLPKSLQMYGQLIAPDPPIESGENQWYWDDMALLPKILGMTARIQISNGGDGDTGGGDTGGDGGATNGGAEEKERWQVKNDLLHAAEPALHPPDFNFIPNADEKWLWKEVSDENIKRAHRESGFSGPYAFQYGGIVTDTVLGKLGEAGSEAVIPLDRMKQIIPNIIELRDNIEVEMNQKLNDTISDVRNAINKITTPHYRDQRTIPNERKVIFSGDIIVNEPADFEEFMSELERRTRFRK